jgi:hypothetical protein
MTTTSRATTGRIKSWQDFSQLGHFNLGIQFCRCPGSGAIQVSREFTSFCLCYSEAQKIASDLQVVCQLNMSPGCSSPDYIRAWRGGGVIHKWPQMSETATLAWRLRHKVDGTQLRMAKQTIKQVLLKLFWLHDWKKSHAQRKRNNRWQQADDHRAGSQRDCSMSWRKLIY